MTPYNEKYTADHEYAVAFDEEREKLRVVVNGMQNRFQHRQALLPVSAADSRTTREIQLKPPALWSLRPFWPVFPTSKAWSTML